MAESVDLQRLIVSMEANYKKLERELNKAHSESRRQAVRIQGEFERMNTRVTNSLATAGNTLRRHFVSLAGTLGVTLGASALVRSIGRAVEQVSALGDAAIEAGVSAERLQVFRFLMTQNGAAAEDADNALKRFNARLGEVMLSGTGPASAAFDALAISITDTSGNMRSAEAIFDEAWEKLSRVADVSQQAAIAADLFGAAAGPRLLQSLQQGTQGMTEAETAARRLGLVLSNETVASAQETGDKLAVLAGIISTRFQQAVVNIAGVAVGANEDFTGFADSVDHFFDVIERNIGLLDNLIGGLIGLTVAGPLGAVIGALAPEVVKLFSASDDAALATNALGDALERNVGIGPAAVGTSDALSQAMATEESLALEAAEAQIALAEARAQAAAAAELGVGIPISRRLEIFAELAAAEEAYGNIRRRIEVLRSRTGSGLVTPTNLPTYPAGQSQGRLAPGDYGQWVPDPRTGGLMWQPRNGGLPPLPGTFVPERPVGGPPTVPLPFTQPEPFTPIPPPGAGGGGGGAESAERIREGLLARLQALRDTVAEEIEIERAGHAARLAELEEFVRQGLISSEDAALLEQELTERHQQRLTEIERAAQADRLAERQAFTSALGDIFGSLSQIIGTESEKALKLSKAFAVAQVAVSTAQGIAQALAEGPGRWIKAAAIAAAGVAQIMAIRRAQPGNASNPSVGGGGGGGSGAGGAAGGGTAFPQAVYVELKGEMWTEDSIRNFLKQLDGVLTDTGSPVRIYPRSA